MRIIIDISSDEGSSPKVSVIPSKTELSDVTAQTAQDAGSAPSLSSQDDVIAPGPSSTEEVYDGGKASPLR